jgi:hypothetical protein
LKNPEVGQRILLLCEFSLWRKIPGAINFSVMEAALDMPHRLAEQQ